MLLIEKQSPYQHRQEAEYFYAWLRHKRSVTFGRVSWNKGDDISRLIKYLILHRIKITKISMRREHVHLSVEDAVLQKGYESALKDFIL